MAAIALAARAYQQSFQTHPNTTLALTGGSLNALGDGVAQATQRMVSPFPRWLRSDAHEPSSRV